MRHKGLSLLTLVLAVMALAQGQSHAEDYPAAPPPPVSVRIDANGVDLISGALNLSAGTLSVGSAESGLSYTYLNTATSAMGGPLGTINVDTTAGVAYVSLGDSTEKFQSPTTADNVTTYQNANGGASTLKYVYADQTYVYTRGDGTVAVYSFATASMLPRTATGGNIVSLTLPTGEQLTYTYKGWSFCGGYYYGCMVTLRVQRITAISSNLGYQLHFSYQSDGVESYDAPKAWAFKQIVAINSAVDYCDPNAAACTGLTQTWPTVTFDGGAIDSAGQKTIAGANFLQRPSGATVTKSSTGTTSFTLSNGVGTWSYSYSDSGTTRTMTVVDPLGRSRVVVSDQARVSVTSDTDALAHTTNYTYDSYGRLTRITKSEGDYTNYTYDGRGNVTELRRVAKPGSGLADIVTAATYDATCANPKTCNKPNTVTDERGNVTSYTYDATHGGVLTATSPEPTSGTMRPQTRYAYSLLPSYAKNSGGTLVQAGSVWKLTGSSTCTSGPWECVGTSLEAKTTVAYASSNLLPTATTSGSGDGVLSATTAMTYDQYGNLETVDGPLAGSADTTRTYYDAVRRPVGKIGPDPDGAGPLLYRATRTSYNPDGRVTSVETGTATGQAAGSMASFVALQRSDAAYDGIGRKISDSLVAGGATQAVTQYDYDAVNRLTCTAMRMNPAAFGSLPASACALGAAGSDGDDRITYTSYDNLDRVTQVTSGYGTSAPQVERASSYTTSGQLATEADGKGNLTTYEYDGFDRPVKVRYPIASSGATSSTGDYEQYTYDAAGNILTDRRRDGTTVAFTYDALNRVQNGLRGEVYAYDNLGRQTSATYGGGVAKATYDALGRVTGEDTYNHPLTYQYDLAGNRTRLTWWDGFYVTYDYDAAGRMQNILQSDGTRVWALAYDDLGRRRYGWSGPGSPATQTNYGYDAASRLSSLSLDLAGTTYDQTWTFAYNAASQAKTRDASNSLYEWSRAQATRSYTVNGLNQYATAAGAAIAYDARGNLSNDGATTYGYDLLNNLTSTSAGASLAYEPTGRLWRVSAGGAATALIYSGSDLVAELDGATGAILRRYVPGPGTDAPVLWYEGSGTGDRRSLLADPLGSIVSVTNSAGATIATNVYDEYGIPAAGNLGRFQYTGQAWIPEVGLYHYKARAYSPTLGRFLQTDPIGYADGMNWYAYVGNDPINMTDPSGTSGGNPCGNYAPYGNTPGDIGVSGGYCNTCPSGAMCLTGSTAYQFAQDVLNNLARNGTIFLGTGTAPQKVQQKSAPQNVRKKTDDVFSCGVKPDGSLGCGMMTRDYLCKSAQDRLKKLAIAGAIPAAWAGYRNYNQLPTGKGGQKALGALQVFMAVEAALDFGDMDVYCK